MSMDCMNLVDPSVHTKARDHFGKQEVVYYLYNKYAKISARLYIPSSLVRDYRQCVL